MKDSLYIIKKDGCIQTTIMEAHFNNIKASDSAWEHPAASISIMIVCAVLDCVMFNQLFKSFLYDSPAIQFLSIIAMLVGFDLAPIYLGIVIKKIHQGLESSKLVSIVLGVAIGIALVFNLVLRVATREYVLPNFGIYDDLEHSRLAFVYSVFAGALPVITSLVSFAVSYINSNPVKSKYLKACKDEMLLEDAIIQFEGILMEYSHIKNYYNELEREDIDRYHIILNELSAWSQYYKHYVREQIAEYIGDPTSTNILTGDILNKRSDDYQDLPIDNMDKRGTLGRTYDFNTYIGDKEAS